MDNVERITAIESIRALKAKYFRCLDTKDWDGFRSTLTSDCAADYTDAGPATKEVAGPQLIGANEFVEWVRTTIGDAITVHHGHMSEIDVVSPTDARGIWSMFDRLWFPADAPLREFEGYGHYHETYYLAGANWLISSIKLTRLQLLVRHDLGSESVAL